jgi:polygalacturonase
MSIDIASPGASAAALRNALRLDLGDGSVSLKDFGAVGDGATDNAAALLAFGTWAKAESAAGRGVYLQVPPGYYKFNHANCQDFLANIRTLVIDGHIRRKRRL